MGWLDLIPLLNIRSKIIIVVIIVTSLPDLFEIHVVDVLIFIH